MSKETANAIPLSDLLEKTCKTIRSLVPEHLSSPRIGIVCGSGLSSLASSLREPQFVEYSKLEGFAESTVPGHKSTLAFGLIGPGEGKPVVAMLGRFHPYEGYALASVTYPIRVMKALGVQKILITNAAGSLNPKIPVGTIVTIRDHFALPNLAGALHPLLGPVTSPSHARFLPLSDAYSPSLRRLAFLAAHKLGLPDDATDEGVYAWVSGPTYETPAEGLFLRRSGADVVGMSTIPEVVVAREEGLEVLVLSLVTNMVVINETYRSIKDEVKAELAGNLVTQQETATVSHGEVLEMGKAKAEVMMQLVAEIISLIE
ncbi:inosine guanosine and [Schizopora paradoxa]|uniref:Purine nucleoside phosphorylase n=1 Tax=Schizopora paradoxa TaxID=27342 RepID=A0A0H2R4B6_9AGAM|nr:inosine guanosine and [Schizopora paradoxa]